MAKHRVTFEVDQSALFDTLHKMEGNMGPVGERLVATLLMGEAGFIDAVGLSIYGIEVVEKTSVEEPVS